VDLVAGCLVMTPGSPRTLLVDHDLELGTLVNVDDRVIMTRAPCVDVISSAARAQRGGAAEVGCLAGSRVDRDGSQDHARCPRVANSASKRGYRASRWWPWQDQ